MERNEILSIVDHTLLAQTATWADIKEILDDAMKYETASACIPAAYVKQAAEYVEGKLPICTVIGFPNGYHTTAVKVFETKNAIANGSSEIDMVINIGYHRNMSVNRRRKDQSVRDRYKCRSRIYQNIHRILNSRSNI